MTLKELSEVYYIDKEIKKDKAQLKELEERSTSTSQTYSHTPSAHSADSKVERYATAIADLQETIRLNEIRLTETRAKITRWINAISDSQTRLIFKLRFLWLLGWDDVAEEIGGGNTSDSVKKRCYRYLK